MAIATQVGDLLEVTFGTYAEGQLGLNVRHARISAVVGNSVTTADIASRLETTFAPEYKGLMQLGSEFQGVRVRIISPIVSPPDYSQLLRGAGEAVGKLLPGQIAGLISFRSNVGGRQGRGRMYVPFPSDVENDALGSPVAGYITRLQALGDLLVGTFLVAVNVNSATLEWVVSKSAIGRTIPIVKAIARTQFGTQRRRSEVNRANAEFGA